MKHFCVQTISQNTTCFSFKRFIWNGTVSSSYFLAWPSKVLQRKKVARQDLGNRATAVDQAHIEVPKQLARLKAHKPPLLYGPWGGENKLSHCYPSLLSGTNISRTLYSHERLAGQHRHRAKNWFNKYLLNTIYYVYCTFCCNSQSKTQTADCRPADLGKIQIADYRLFNGIVLSFPSLGANRKQV